MGLKIPPAARWARWARCSGRRSGIARNADGTKQRHRVAADACNDDCATTDDACQGGATIERRRRSGRGRRRARAEGAPGKVFGQTACPQAPPDHTGSPRPQAGIERRRPFAFNSKKGGGASGGGAAVEESRRSGRRAAGVIGVPKEGCHRSRRSTEGGARGGATRETGNGGRRRRSRRRAASSVDGQQPRAGAAARANAHRGFGRALEDRPVVRAEDELGRHAALGTDAHGGPSNRRARE